MVFLRSSSAAGRILELDIADARKAPGVLAVLTADDLHAAGVGSFVPGARHNTPAGEPMFLPPFYPLSRGRVRYVGDPVAAIIAETREAAEDAAELILLDIEDAGAVVTTGEALAPGAQAVWDEVPDNRAFLVERGDAQAVEEAFARAAHRIEQRLDISRVVAASIEPRSALALYDTQDESFTLRLGTQAPHRIARSCAELLGVDPGRMRVISEDTGGAFGIKNGPYAEYLVALFAARKLARPVRWQSSRLESFLSDHHAREQSVDASLALDEEGHFLALKLDIRANIGAYLGTTGTNPMVNNIGTAVGVYRIPAAHVSILGVHSHTQSMAPYRGAGRPEATYIIERLADLAARKLGLDLPEIRRRNMIRPEEMPYKTALTYSYDSGDFPAVMERALEISGWRGFPARKAESEARGRLRGIGIANPIEIAGGPMGNPNPEFVGLEIAEDGGVTLRLGTSDTGQGHRTSFLQVLGETLGIDDGDVTFFTGDTKTAAQGTGTFGSRSAAAFGASLMRVKEEIIAQAMPQAAEALEAAEADLVFEDGVFSIVGTDRSITLQEVARQRRTAFAADAFETADDCSFPNGCHICEVEVDPETGGWEILGYWVVDDVGEVLNPLLVAGQLHGGIAQGAGQAGWEVMRYESGSGQLQTASFMDYAMPRANDLPALNVEMLPVPTKTNPLGVKGAGEAGVVGSLPATVSAVCDALAPLGVYHLDMPMTPQRVWEALRNAPGARAKS